MNWMRTWGRGLSPSLTTPSTSATGWRDPHPKTAAQTSDEIEKQTVRVPDTIALSLFTDGKPSGDVPISKIGNYLATRPSTQRLKRDQRDGLRHVANRAVAKREIHATWMIAAEIDGTGVASTAGGVRARYVFAVVAAAGQQALERLEGRIERELRAGHAVLHRGVGPEALVDQ